LLSNQCTYYHINNDKRGGTGNCFKTVPQLNVFMVGMPLKIILGLAVMVITIPMFLNLVENLITGIDNEMHIFLRIWHQNETEIFSERSLSKFGKNKDLKSIKQVPEE